MDRKHIADAIVARLEAEAKSLAGGFGMPGRIGSCQVENLLPSDIARTVYSRFPSTEQMTLKRSIKESKHVTAQLDALDPLIEEIVYAFQDPRVVDVVGRIAGLEGLEPDAELYAGGISVMQAGGYLRPHLDNSHDAAASRYRALNLLYYVTPDWVPESGGSLQLWDDGPTGAPRTLPASFNSLAIMVTDVHSWHSVSEVKGVGRRCCISNYYFTRKPPGAIPYFHSTSFRAENGRGFSDLLMRADNALRTAVLRHAPRLWRNPHVYQRNFRQ